MKITSKWSYNVHTFQISVTTQEISTNPGCYVAKATQSWVSGRQGDSVLHISVVLPNLVFAYPHGDEPGYLVLREKKKKIQ